MNHVYMNLESLEGSEFKVSETQMVGKNIWYHGTFNGKETWIHESNLKEEQH